MPIQAIPVASRAQKVKPAYELHKIDKEVTVRKVRATFTENANGKRVLKYEFYEVKEPFGWMAYFPQGHSIRIRNADELKRLQLDHPASLIDMDTGEEVEQIAPRSLREQIDGATAKEVEAD